MKCRHCNTPLEHIFIDLGHQPPSNAYLKEKQLLEPEVYYPLKVYVCDRCWLVQIPEQLRADELFVSDYAYFSSISQTWMEHVQRYVESIVNRVNLNENSFVVEVASNDGHLLQFVRERNIPCLGIEPTHSTASAARQRGIETIEAFFNTQMGSQLRVKRQPADLLVGNNVLAHVPDINDFVGGIRELLAPEGVATLEFPHLLQLVNKREFDTIYHEHYSYLSLHAVKTIFASQKLRIFDVEELPTHGGSLRIYVAHQESQTWNLSPRVKAVLESEYQAGMLDLSYYLGFQWQAEQIKNNLLGFLVEQKQKKCIVVAYGAAAKGNTLLNFAGIKPDLLPYVYDAAPSKQGRFLPGSHIPILSPEKLPEQNPDYVLILPWNLKEEITHSHSYIRNWGGKFVTAIPYLEIIEV